MEQACYKCGQAVEEGTPFCPQCSAPQIRVIVAEPTPVAVAAGVSVVDGEAQTVSGIAAATPLATSWSHYARPCALAGLIAATTMVLELVVPLIAVIGAGFLAVALYRRWNLAATMDAKAGALLGALCGLFTTGIGAILGTLRIILLHKTEDVRRWMLEIIQQTATRYPDPQAQPTLDFLRSPGGLVFLMVFLLLAALLLFVVLGTLGGTLAGVAMGRRNGNES
jgi:hypothetical protein